MANKNCPDCHGTGKIKLLISIVVCKCEKTTSDINSEAFNYADAISDVDRKWNNACCSCHISPPCGFCTRYADANLDEPEYCRYCSEPSPKEKTLLHKCSKCGLIVCDLCYQFSNMTCRRCEYFSIGP